MIPPRPTILTLFMILAPFVIFRGAPALAHNNVKERCSFEWAAAGEIVSHHVSERHAWASKCKLLDDHLLRSIQNDFGMIASFLRHNYSSYDHAAPFDRNAPCDPPGTWFFFTMCPLGCFSSLDTVLFGSEWLTLPVAAKKDLRDVTALDEGSSPFRLAIRHDNPIDYFSAGDEHQALLRFVVENGASATVTQHHPMVLSDGTVLPAVQVPLGERLLTLEGAQRLVSITRHAPQGRVWNVRPVSPTPLHNIIIANGILTGSLRFQNEWANDGRRSVLFDILSSATVSAPFTGARE